MNSASISTAYVLVRRARNGHPAGFRDAFQPRRNIDAVAKNILALDQHVAEVDADPVEDALRLESALVAGRHLLLHRQGALDRCDHGREFNEHPVARGFEQPPAVGGNDWLSGFAPLAHETCGPGLVLAHHARIANDIGGEDRGELAGGCHPSGIPALRMPS